eukprot:355524-Chlamydomonas_euryale.AAC.30
MYTRHPVCPQLETTVAILPTTTYILASQKCAWSIIINQGLQPLVNGLIHAKLISAPRGIHCPRSMRQRMFDRGALRT